MEMEIEIAHRHSDCSPNSQRLVAAARRILQDAGFDRGTISLAIVGDDEIHRLNRRYLNHDYPTDVLSFLLQSNGSTIEGEIVVSADTAARQCAQYGWTVNDELLLYVIHGTLHLAGWDDQHPEDRAAMRAQERRYLSHFGLTARYDDEAGAGAESQPFDDKMISQRGGAAR